MGGHREAANGYRGPRMNVCLLVSLGPGDLADLADLVDHPRPFPLAIAAHPVLLDEARHEAPKLASRLAALDVEWVRTGWDADLSLLPTPTVRALLLRESEILDAVDLAAPGLWLRGADPGVLDVLPAGVDLLVLEGIGRPGVVAHHATVLPALPALDGRNVSGDVPTGAVAVARRLAAFEDLAGRLRRRDEVVLVTPSLHLATQRPTGRLPWPKPPARGTERLHRKLARTASVAKPNADVFADLAAAASPDAERPLQALARARSRIDAAAHRRDEWVSVTDLDWDADGEGDIEIETPRLSVVVDPADSLTLPVLDDMVRAVPLEGPDGAGSLCRLATGPVRFSPGPVERSRGSVIVPFAGDRVACRLALEKTRITLSYRVGEGPALRLGPDLRFGLGVPSVRVDGSAWSRPATGVELAGHRLRLAFADRQVLVSSRLPSSFHVEAGDGEVSLWIHRDVSGGGTYEVTVELSAPPVERIERSAS